MEQTRKVLVIKLKAATIYMPLAIGLVGMAVFAVAGRWHNFVLFSILTLMSGKELISDSRTLTLTLDGLSIGKKKQAPFLKWSEIESFTLKGNSGVFKTASTRIGIKMIQSSPPADLYRKISKKLSGYDYEIGPGYEMSTRDIFAALTDWKNAASGIAGQASPGRQTGSPESALTPRWTYFAAAAAALVLIGALTVIFLSKRQTAGRRGPDQIAARDDSVYVHFGHKLYLLSLSGELRRTVDLESLGIRGKLEDLQILRTGEVVIGDATGSIRLCDVREMKCRMIGPRDKKLESPFKFIADDSANLLYVVDVGRHKLFSKEIGNGDVAEIAGSDILKYPNGVALGNDGLLYVADTNNHRVISFKKSGSGWLPGKSFTVAGKYERNGRDWPVAISQGQDGRWWILNADGMLANADLVVYDSEGKALKRVDLPARADPIDISWAGDVLLYTDFRQLEVYSLDPVSGAVRPFGNAAFRSELAAFQHSKDAAGQKKYMAGMAVILAVAVSLIVLLALAKARTGGKTPRIPKIPPPVADTQTARADIYFPGGSPANDREKLGAAMRANRTIWIAMLFSLFLYVAVAHLLAQSMNADTFKDLPSTPIRDVLSLVSFAEIGLIHYMRKKLLPAEKSGPARYAQANGTADMVTSRYATAMIISLALAESIGVYGFVLFILTKDFTSLYAFVSLAAAAMIIYRPKQEELEALAADLKRQQSMLPGAKS